MSSADENGKSDTGFDGDEETKVDLDKAAEGNAETAADGGADGDSGTDSDSGADNADRRAARQAKKQAASNDRQLTVSVTALKRFGLAILAIAAVVVIALSVFQVVQKDNELDAFADSKAAASHFVETYFTAMSKPNATADSMRGAVSPLSTGEFKKRMSDDAEESIAFFQKNKIEDLKTTITSSMVESFDADRATVVVATELSGVSAVRAAPGRDRFLMQVEMNKVDGEWLVSALEAGPMGGGEQGQQPAPAPETPAPAPPTP